MWLKCIGCLVGGSGGMPPQENFRFLTLWDCFWCILGVKLQKLDDLLLNLVVHIFFSCNQTFYYNNILANTDNMQCCLTLVHVYTQNNCTLNFTQPRCKWGRILLILWIQGWTKCSTIPWVNFLFKVQHGDGDNSEYALRSGKQPTSIGVLTSAFAAIRYFTTGRCPSWQATCSGVAPI